MYDYLIFEKSPPYMALLDSYTFINIWEILQNLFQNWDLRCIFNVLKIFLPLNSALKSPYMIISSCTIIWIWKLVPLHLQVYSILYDYSIAKSRFFLKVIYNLPF